MILFSLIHKQGRPLMPHEVLRLVVDNILKPAGECNEDGWLSWSTIAQWCYLAAQADKDSNIKLIRSMLTQHTTYLL